MSVVVEIGCGKTAGPYIEGASHHYIVDTDEEAVKRAGERDPRFTQIVGTAACLELPDDSVDTILARNVFGDPTLGVGAARAMEILSVSPTLLDELVNRQKTMILEEAARLLVFGGKIIVVEQSTPEVATEFIAGLGSETVPLPSCLTQPKLVGLAEVTPMQYASRYADAQTWVSAKIA